MKILDLHDLVYLYYKRILFLFVPNVCNSKCSFCYGKPKFSKYAVLSDCILNRTYEIVDAARNIGFNEFRITGGEPLLFENISELFSIFKEKNVSYTLLTNSMNIQKYFELFKNNEPKKITISYHSKTHYNSVFGIEYNTDLLDQNIRELCKRKINLTISILFLDENKREILSHILHLKSLGVKSIKLIYPSDNKIRMNFKREFIESIEKVTSIEGIDIRYSELNANMCSMVNRGFLSFHLDQNKIYGCCNSIFNERFISSINSFDSLKTTIWNFYNEAQILTEFPCKNYVEYCPIAITPNANLMGKNEEEYGIPAFIPD
jgi:molybdenum cofactor biosynthesis enzyme MoaA